jgi:hypothetical protein
MSRIQTRVALDKRDHPERYCPNARCLWRTGDGSYCPRHGRAVVVADVTAESETDGGGYELNDPKHPGYYSTYADVWDNREKGL